MDFALTEEQEAVAQLAARVFERRLTAEVRKEVERSGDRFDAALWSQLAEAGLLGVALPDEVGGAGHGLLEHCALLVATDTTAAPVPLWAVTTAALAIDHLAAAPERAAIVPELARGATLATVALAEPDAPDPRAPATIARPDGGRWRLDGVKTCVPAATRAGWLVITARRPDGQVGLFLAAPGPTLTIEPQRATTGEVHGLVTLAATPATLLGGPDAVTWLLERATVGLCALELGIVEHVLGLTARYTAERVQFDRPIATFQAVAQRAADAFIDVETIRLTLWEAAWRLAEGRSAARQVAIARCFAAEAGQRVTYTAQHLHGGIGFDLDYPLARYYPLSKWLELQLGGASAHLAHLGDLLATE
jgi:3-oxocholest-4-en-26-oyl-CoA dehydrogenase beta subunit